MFRSGVPTRSEQQEVFDRELKRRQREWAFNIVESDYYDYLRKEAAERLVDRIEDISRSFPLALELGCHRGHIYELLNANPGLDGKGGVGGIETLIQCDTSPSAIRHVAALAAAASSSSSPPSPSSSSRETAPLVETYTVLADEEFLPFKEGQFDIVLSSMNLHWVNDLPSTFLQIKNCLKPDGVFLGAMLGGSTLQELRYCFYLAEQERKGGLSPHASPLALASDVASLMQAAGFNLPTVDVDTVQISYPDAFTLMEHLGRMGEGTAAYNRHSAVGKDTFLAMASLYQEMYGLEDGSVRATFQVIYMIGWAPDAKQPKACKRGSATHSLKDLAGTPPAGG